MEVLAGSKMFLFEKGTGCIIAEFSIKLFLRITACLFDFTFQGGRLFLY